MPTCHLDVVPDSTKVSTGTFSANVIAKIASDADLLELLAKSAKMSKEYKTFLCFSALQKGSISGPFSGQFWAGFWLHFGLILVHLLGSWPNPIFHSLGAGLAGPWGRG